MFRMGGGIGPHEYEWARKNIEKIADEYADDNSESGKVWKRIFDYAVQGIRVAEATVFPEDMFDYNSVGTATKLSNMADEACDKLRDDEGGGDVEIMLDYDMANVLMMAAEIYKNICIAYNKDKFREDIERVLKKAAKLTDEEDTEAGQQEAEE